MFSRDFHQKITDGGEMRIQKCVKTRRIFAHEYDLSAFTQCERKIMKQFAGMRSADIELWRYGIGRKSCDALINLFDRGLIAVSELDLIKIERNIKRDIRISLTDASVAMLLARCGVTTVSQLSELNAACDAEEAAQEAQRKRTLASRLSNRKRGP